jgi:TolB protein
MKAFLSALVLLLGTVVAPPVRAQGTPSPAPSSDRIRMEIVGPGSRLSAIALPELKNLGGDDAGEISGAFVDTLWHNLKLSGYFREVDPHAYVEDSEKSGYELGRFNMADWSALNADFLVKGAVTVHEDVITLEARLFDVAQQRQMMGKRYTGSGDDVARMARRFADEILKATTGVPGPFDAKLAFVSTRAGRFKEIYTAAIDGQDVFKVTNNPTINLFPSLDQSTRRLLYLSYKTGRPALYLADLATRREIRIGSFFGVPIGGAIAPDGSHIAAAIEHDGVTDLHLLDPQGREIRALTSGGSINVSPAFSPDGAKLAFTSDRSGTPQIYLMGLDGGDPQRITYRGEYNTTPAFSPKGDRLAYQSRENGRFDIYAIGLNGGEPLRLTEGEGSNESPSWSPDGRYIVFSSTRDGRAHLYLMQVETGKIISALLEDNGDDTSPVWSWWLPE